MSYYDTYHHVGQKAFFVRLLQNSLIAIFLGFVWFALVLLKSHDAGSALTFLNTPEIVTVASLILDWAIVAGLFIIFLTFLGGIAVTLVQYLTFYFMLDEHGIKLKRGLFFKQEISVPYRQIQDINIERPLLYQILGVCHLNILTAGEDDQNSQREPNEIEFPIVDRALAVDIREELLRRSNIQLVSQPVEHPVTHGV